MNMKKKKIKIIFCICIELTITFFKLYRNSFVQQYVIGTLLYYVEYIIYIYTQNNRIYLYELPLRKMFGSNNKCDYFKQYIIKCVTCNNEIYGSTFLLQTKNENNKMHESSEF